MKNYAFGVDIGGTTCKIGFFETSGKLLDKWEIKTNTENNGASILDDVAVALKAKMDEQGLSYDDIQGVGIGVPGPVNSKGEVPFCVNLGWGAIPVETVMSEKMGGILVKCGNDANVAALGEMWQGGAKGYEDIVMVTLGTGVGGGIIIGGKVLAGFNGAGGEFGHMTMNTEDTELCACGRPACLEWYASANGLARLAKKALAKDHDTTTLDGVDPVTAKDVFDAYKAGDKVAAAIVKEFAAILGDGLNRIAVVVDPEIFVIGGGLSKAGQPLLDVVQEEFIKKAYNPCKATKFALATLGNDAGIYGCVQMVL